MRCRHRIYLALGVGGWALAALGQTSNEVWLEARAVPQPGRVTVTWTPAANWPTSVVAVVLKRAAVSSEGVTGAWREVTAAPIAPSAALGRNWDLIETKPRYQQRLKAMLQGRIQDGRITSEEARDYLGFLRTAGPRDLMALGDRVGNVPELGLMMGLGFVDRNVPGVGRYVYAVHAVDGEGMVSSAAVASVSCEFTDTKDRWAQLYGERTPDGVRLLWIPREWQDGVTGFRVARRAAGTNTWTWLGTNVIRPSIVADRPWADEGVGPKEAARLGAWVSQRIRDGSLESLSPDAFLARMQQASLAEFGGLRVLVTKSFDQALALGFGCIDRIDAEHTDYDYGLFPVDQHGMADEEPVDVWAWNRDRAERITRDGLFAITFEPTTEGILVRWTVDDDFAEAASLEGFEVYRKDADAADSSYVRLTVSPLGPVEHANGRLTFFWQDREAASTVPYVYALAPVSVFGTEFPRQHGAYRWTPPKIVFQIAPVITNLYQSVDGGVALFWKWTGSASNVKGFVVERREKQSEAFAAVSPLLPLGQLHYADTNHLAPGEFYTYRIATVTRDDERVTAQSMMILIRDLTPPPPPTSFTAEWTTRGGQGGILLRWASQDMSRVKSFALYADVRPDLGVERLASIPDLTASEYFLPPVGGLGREYTLRVAAISDADVEGPYAEARCYVPMTEMPMVAITRHEGLGEKGEIVRLEWTYPELRELRGFRIFEDGKLVADEAGVGPRARFWVSPELEANALHTFEMVAVSDAGSSSLRSVPVEYYFIDRAAIKETNAP